MSDIAYSAIVLDEKSRTRLINTFKNYIPSDWEFIADHMTINLGDIDPIYEKYLGFPIRLRVETFAMNDKVAAVGVTGFPVEGKKEHITIAVNRKNFGKPAMSNDLVNWEKIKRPISLVGKVTEVPLSFKF